MTTQPEDTATECSRIANALKDMEARRFAGQRISFTEIMATHTTAPADVLFHDAPELEARKCGMLDQ